MALAPLRLRAGRIGAEAPAHHEAFGLQRAQRGLDRRGGKSERAGKFGECDRAERAEPAADEFAQGIVGLADRAGELRRRGDPGDGAAHNARGAALLQLGRYEDALAAFGEAIALNPENAAAWCNKAAALSSLRRYDDAIDACAEAVSLEGWWSTPRIRLAGIYLTLGDTENAYSILRAAVDKIGGNAELLSARGNIELERQDYSAAAESFREAAAHDPGDPGHLLWQAYARFLAFERPGAEDAAFRQNLLSVVALLEKARNLADEKEPAAEAPALPWMMNGHETPGLETLSLRAKILHFTAYCYYRLKYYGNALNALAECSGEDPSGETGARKTIAEIWKNKLKPPFWRWWLSDPVSPWPKRIAFGALVLSLVTLLFIHPLVWRLIAPYEVNWTLYATLTFVVIALILLPLFERTRDSEFEFSMKPDYTLGPVISTVSIEDHMRDKRRRDRLASAEKQRVKAPSPPKTR